jgi:hypothetical protein
MKIYRVEELGCIAASLSKIFFIELTLIKRVAGWGASFKRKCIKALSVSIKTAKYWHAAKTML